MSDDFKRPLEPVLWRTKTPLTAEQIKALNRPLLPEDHPAVEMLAMAAGSFDNLTPEGWVMLEECALECVKIYDYVGGERAEPIIFHTGQRISKMVERGPSPS